MRLLLFLVATCAASFCINGMYEYSYDVSCGNYSDTKSEIVRSYSTVMVLNLDTEKLSTRRVDDVKIGDYILSHNGYFTYVKDIRRVNIANPQLYCRKNINDRNVIHVKAGLQGEHNVVFTDSQLNIVNETIESSSNGITTVKQYGLYNFTDDINYRITSDQGTIQYWLNGIDVVNQAAIISFMGENNITAFTHGPESYTNIVNTIHPCEGIDLITESGSATVNGLFFF